MHIKRLEKELDDADNQFHKLEKSLKEGMIFKSDDRFIYEPTLTDRVSVATILAGDKGKSCLLEKRQKLKAIKINYQDLLKDG